MNHPLITYIKLNKRPFILGVLFLIATNLFDGVAPYFLKIIIDLIVSSSDASRLNQNIFFYFIIMLLLAGVRYGWRYFFGTYHTLAAEKVRNQLFFRYVYLDQRFFTKSPIGELMSLITNDVNSFRNAIGPSLLVLLDALFMAMTVVPFMLMMNPSWTWKTMIFLPLVPFIIWKVMELIHKNYQLEQVKFAEISAFSAESISGIRSIKGFHKEFNQIERYNRISREYEKYANKTALIDAFFIPVMEFGVASGTVILLFVSAQDMMAGLVTIGTFVAFQRYIEKMVWPVTALGFGLSNFRKGMASYARIKNVLDQKSQIIDDGKLTLNEVTSIEFDHVSFKYEESTVFALNDVSFHIFGRQRLGIIGSVGSGKSTIAQLLVRIMEPTQGRILINGIDYRQFTLSSLRGKLALIPQDAFLFSDTVKNNLFYGDLNSPYLRKMHEITDKVSLSEEVNELPQKFETMLGEKGVNLSGGQKQRLTIGRGLIANASILILDDALSAVDTKTENEIINNAINHSEHAGLIVISHRLPIIQHLDQLLILNEGTVAGFGSTKDLLKSNAQARVIAEMQGVHI